MIKDVGVIIYVGDTANRKILNEANDRVQLGREVATYDGKAGWQDRNDDELYIGDLAVFNFSSIEYNKREPIALEMGNRMRKEGGTLMIAAERFCVALEILMEWYADRGLYAEVVL